MKEFLSQKGVKYTERDISKDAQAINELKEMGIMTTPVTKINGDIAVGFDKAKLKELLGL